MSKNGLSFDTSNTLLQQQRNCLNLDNSQNFNLYQKTKSADDQCFVEVKTVQSVGPGQYQTMNFYDCECLIPKTAQVATSLPTVFYKNGYDVGGCVIDQSSDIRVGKTKRFPKCKNQLFERPYLTTPNLSRGPGNTVLESQLLPGEATGEKRQCNTLSGIFIPQQFTPLVPNLYYNVQNPVHLIPEVAEAGWVWGGAPSRLVVRDIDYLERCGYQYENKVMNSEFWKDKHNYL